MRPYRRAIALVLAVAACSGGDSKTTAPQSASLSIFVNGPSNFAAAIHVSGPNGYSHDVTMSTTLSNIPGGVYLIVAHDTLNGGDIYHATADSMELAVPADDRVTLDTVNYAVSSGRLAFFVTGLPAGVAANIEVDRPDSTLFVTAADTVKRIPAGSIVVRAYTVAQGTTTYGGIFASAGNITGSVFVTQVPASLTPVVDTIEYRAMTATLKLTVNAPPAGLSPQILVTGPFGFSRSITTAGVVNMTSLPLGLYHVAGPLLSTATEEYSAGLPVDYNMNADGFDIETAITYRVATGSITVNVSGVPGGTNAAVSVVGPDSVIHPVTATTTLYKLVPGVYSITSSNVVAGGVPVIPDNADQASPVVASLIPNVLSVAYAPFDLAIDGMYITQASQTYAGTVPLILGRDGYLRVFVKANRAYPLAVPVRVRWYASGVLVRTDTIPSPGGSAPLTITEGTLNSSWNLAIPKSLIQANLSVLADVDPANATAEGNETNNSFPVSGVPLALDVRPASVFHVMAVPVMERSNHLTGNVTAGNVNTFFSMVQRIHPIPSYQAAIHAVYTTADTMTLAATDFNGEWENVLNEMVALRVTEGASDSLYYYGVVHPGYPGGVAGIGFIGAPAAVGWDEAIPDQIAAHEIGHNWGRYHAPCGGASGVDPNWPTDPRYQNAEIGVFGFDLATSSLVSPISATDIMSYCQVQQWSSDYTYRGVMDFRAASPMVMAAAAMPPQPALLVWGRMRGSEIELEPAFEITTRPVVPSGSGAYTIEGVDASGGTVFRYAFDPHEIADLPHAASSFAFAIPLASFDRSRLVSLRLSGRGREVRLDGGSAAEAMRTGSMPASGLAARAMGDGSAEVRWDGARYRMALIRDARTGEVLSFARHGSVRLAAATRDLVVTVSNGVRSTTERVTAQ